MFCKFCGAWMQEKYKFCPRCGRNASENNTITCPATSVEQFPSVDSQGTAGAKRPCSFDRFRSLKNDERQSLSFRARNKKCKTEEGVTINIGLMRQKGESADEVEIIRGKSLPLKISKKANAEEVLQEALKKRKAHDRSFRMDRSYSLAYPDGTEVVNVPGTSEPFTLVKYKEELGKGFTRIVLYLSFSEEVECGIDLDATPRWASTSLQVNKNRSSNKAPTVTTDDQESKPNNVKSLDTCSICLEEVYEDDGATPNCCKDLFHHICIQEWLETGDTSAKCPTCGTLFTRVVKVVKANPSKHQNQPPTNASYSYQSSGTLDYMYLQHEYGDIIWISDESDKEESLSEDETVNFETKTRNSTTFSEDLQKLCTRKVNELNEESYIRLKVRRNSVWQDVKLKCGRLKEKQLSENSFVKVEFVGEPAVDEGGPKRELFCLLHKEVYSTSLFEGKEEGRGKIFSHNFNAIQNNDYFIYGLCCGLALVNGAVGPQFFSPPVVDYILNGNVNSVKCSVENIPSKATWNKLEEIDSITDAKEFEDKVVTYFGDSLRDMGYAKPIVISNKKEFLRTATIHYTLVHSICELNQFIDGLNVVGVLQILRNHPVESRAILQCSYNKLTAETVDGLFTYNLSDEGSNRNQQEKSILFFWSQFLEDVERGEIQKEVGDCDRNSRMSIVVSLQAVLSFITGSTHIPPLGFHPPPSIVFLHDVKNRKMHVSTCSNVLFFPVSEHFLEYNRFKEEFLFCMLNAPGFGNV